MAWQRPLEAEALVWREHRQRRARRQWRRWICGEEIDLAGAAPDPPPLHQNLLQGLHHEVRVLAVMGMKTVFASLGDHDLLAFAHNIG
jgi:hypothetical protein